MHELEEKIIPKTIYLCPPSPLRWAITLCSGHICVNKDIFALREDVKVIAILQMLILREICHPKENIHQRNSKNRFLIPKVLKRQSGELLELKTFVEIDIESLFSEIDLCEELVNVDQLTSEKIQKIFTTRTSLTEKKNQGISPKPKFEGILEFKRTTCGPNYRRLREQRRLSQEKNK